MLNSGIIIVKKNLTSLLDEIKSVDHEAVRIVQCWTPVEEAPIATNGTWVFLIIALPQEDYLYTKIYASVAGSDGNNLRSWIGNLNYHSNQIFWKELQTK